MLFDWQEKKIVKKCCINTWYLFI